MIYKYFGKKSKPDIATGHLVIFPSSTNGALDMCGGSVYMVLRVFNIQMADKTTKHINKIYLINLV